MTVLDVVEFSIKRGDSFFTKKVSLGKMPEYFSSQQDIELKPEVKPESFLDKYPKKEV